MSGSECVVTVSWSEPVISCNGSTSQYVFTISPPTTECPSGRCEVGRGEETLTLTVRKKYHFSVRADTCNNTQTGQDSDQHTIQMEGNEMICNYMYQKGAGNTTVYLSSISHVAAPESCEYYYNYNGSSFYVDTINVTWKTINVSDFLLFL